VIGKPAGIAAFVQCKNGDCNLGELHYLWLQQRGEAFQPGVDDDAH